MKNQRSKKFRKGDNVKVTSGKDKGREGKIEKIFAEEQTALLPGINVYKKHIKAANAADKKGGIYDIPRPISFAKIAIICPHCKKATRVGWRLVDNKRIRICRKCDRAFEIK